jgi:hypothetical protein
MRSSPAFGGGTTTRTGTRVTAPAPIAPKAPAFLRPALALLAGLGVFVAVVVLGTFAAYIIVRATDPQHPTTGLLVALLAVYAVGAVVAGLATGRMTSGRSLYTLFLLAIIPSMSSLIPVLKGTAGIGEPQWYLLTRPAVILLGILIGGIVERRRSDAASLPV